MAETVDADIKDLETKEAKAFEDAIRAMAAASVAVREWRRLNEELTKENDNA